jgi:cellulose synthase operon protein C
MREVGKEVKMMNGKTLNKILKFVTVTALSAATVIPSTSAWAKNDQQKKASVEEELQFKAGDEEGNELKALKAELLISKSDEMALKQLQKLLHKYRGTAMEPSLLFRLAEIYMRRAKTSTFFEVHRDDNNAVRFSPMATAKESSKQWVTKAVSTYDQIEGRFIHYRDMDLVLFNNAFARQILGKEKSAVERYRKVIDDFSESPLVPDCHLAIGESLFNSKDFEASFDEFQKIRSFPDSRVFPYGLYKGAWALYNLHRTNAALKQLEEVVDYSKKADEAGITNHLDLTREALDDMVVFYEDVGKPADAVGYFRGQGGDQRAGDMALKLGQIYQRHGRLKYMETVYLDLIDHLPKSAERVQMHRDLMDSYESTKERAKVVTQLETLGGLCDESGNWSKAQTPEAKDQCWKVLEEAGKLYASKWHKEFRKNNSQELAALTARAYEGLLKYNKVTVAEDKIRYNYAELLFQQQNFRKASEQYSRTAHVTKDAKLKHDSSYGALVALEKAVGEKWSDIDERLFAVLAQDYITMNPKGPYVTDVKFKKAFIAYEKGRYDESAPQLKDLGVHFYNTPRGVKAAQLYLDVLNLQKKYEALRDESLVFVTKFPFDAQTKADFKKIHQQASFTVVQNLESAKKYTEAMNAYLAFVREDTKSALADKALYNAVRCANLAGDLSNAAKLSEQLINDYPASTYKSELGHSLVTLYEAQAQLGLAAKTMLRLAEWEPSKARSYTLSGADYKALNGEWPQAIQLYTQLSQKYANTAEGHTALERLEAYAEKNNQWDKASKLLEQIIENKIQPEASIAAHKIAQHAYEKGDEDKAFKLAKRTVGMRKENNVSSWALAQSRLIQARILEKEFNAAGVKARPDRLTMVLAIKTEKLSNAQKAYQEAISFGDRPTAVEALVHMAAMFGSFSDALEKIEAPADFSAADKQKFKDEIENMALPISEKNAETLQLALKQAKDLQLHDETIASIQAELNRLSRKNTKGKVAVEIAAPENVLPVVD